MVTIYVKLCGNNILNYLIKFKHIVAMANQAIISLSLSLSLSLRAFQEAFYICNIDTKPTATLAKSTTLILL